MWRNIVKRLMLCALGVATCVTASSAAGQVVKSDSGPCPKAASLTTAMNTQLNAPYASLELYEPAGGQEYKLLEALVKSGPWGPLEGVTVNSSAANTSAANTVCIERILEVQLSGENRGTAFLVLSQFFNRGAAEKVAQRRKEAIKSLVIRPPVVMHLSDVEHLAANWGWETGGPQKVETARSLQEMLNAKLSVSLLKIGYTGQTAIVAFFPAGTSREQVLAEAKATRNLEGAAIFFDKTHNQFVMYSEFFQTPQTGPTRPAPGAMAGLVLDHQPAIVVQNYEAR